MGQKKDQPPAAEAEKKEDAKEQPEEEDSPEVKELKAIDDKYLALEKEYEKEDMALLKKYRELQKPLLEQRAKLLQQAKGEGSTASAEESAGTPALPGFWLQAMKNHPAFQEEIESYDEPVLNYVRDMSYQVLDEENPTAGFKVTWSFAPNPYFTNEELWKEYHLGETNPYNGDVKVKEVKSCTIEWQAGKNVTVEKTTKKVKGGGAKKAKQKGKEKEEPRPSIFRSLFRNLKQGDPLPADTDVPDEVESEDGDDYMEYLLDQEYEMGMAIREYLIPYAVRWYTGEAAPEEDDDDEDDEEEDEDEDDDDDDDDDDDEDDVKPKAGAKAKKGSGKGKKGENPECKQQ